MYFSSPSSSSLQTRLSSIKIFDSNAVSTHKLHQTQGMTSMAANRAFDNSERHGQGLRTDRYKLWVSCKLGVNDGNRSRLRTTDPKVAEKKQSEALGNPFKDLMAVCVPISTSCEPVSHQLCSLPKVLLLITTNLIWFDRASHTLTT